MEGVIEDNKKKGKYFREGVREQNMEQEKEILCRSYV